MGAEVDIGISLVYTSRMKTRVQKWGNSLGVRIPKAFAEELDLQPDAPVDVTVKSGKVVIIPLEDEKPTLEDLLEQITAKNVHREIKTGDVVGNEAW